MSTNDPVAEKPNVVSLADEEAVKQVLVDSIFGLWDVVNNLTRIRPSRRDRYRVTIFGSARAKDAYEETSVPRGPPRWARHHHWRRARSSRRVTKARPHRTNPIGRIRVAC
jgi:hypothetical protein